jgi:hypothetical protein
MKQDIYSQYEMDQTKKNKWRNSDETVMPGPEENTIIYEKP